MQQPAFMSYGSYSDPRTQAAFARMLGYLRVSPDINAVVSMFTNAYPGSFQTQSIPFGARNTETLMFKYGTSNLVLSGGTQGTTHVLKMLQGWAQPAPEERFLGASLAYGDAAQALLDAVDPGWFADGQEWIFAGHSFGGSQLTALAVRLRASRPASRITVFSYGSPRPGNEDFQRRAEGCNVTRWYNDTDAVPRIPPHTDEQALLFLPLPNELCLGCNRQVSPAVGRMIAPDGTVQDVELSPIPLSVSEPSLFAWILGSNALGAQAHAIAEYERRFNLMPLPTAQVQTGVSRPRNDDTPLVQTVRQRNTMIDVAVGNLGGQPFPAGGPRFPAPDTSKRYVIHRAGDHWIVLFGDDVVGIGPGKRQARKIARAGNRANRAAT